MNYAALHPGCAILWLIAVLAASISLILRDDRWLLCGHFERV